MTKEVVMELIGKVLNTLAPEMTIRTLLLIISPLLVLQLALSVWIWRMHCALKRIKPLQFGIETYAHFVNFLQQRMRAADDDVMNATEGFIRSLRGSKLQFVVIETGAQKCRRLHDLCEDADHDIKELTEQFRAVHQIDVDQGRVIMDQIALLDEKRSNLEKGKQRVVKLVELFKEAQDNVIRADVNQQARS